MIPPSIVNDDTDGAVPSVIGLPSLTESVQAQFVGGVGSLPGVVSLQHSEGCGQHDHCGRRGFLKTALGLFLPKSPILKVVVFRVFTLVIQYVFINPVLLNVYELLDEPSNRLRDESHLGHVL